VVLGLFLGAAPAWAGHPRLDEGKAAYERGQFRVALLKLTEAERDPKLADDDRVQLHFVRGACLHAMRKPAEANRSFDALLRLRPLHEPSALDAPPDVLAAFHARAEEFQKAQAVRLTAPALEGGRLTITAERHPQQVDHVVVFIRAAGETSYLQTTLPVVSGTASGMLQDLAFWERQAEGGAVELLVEAVNKRDVPVARAGTGTAPLRFTVDAANRNAALQALTPVAPPQALVPPPDLVAAVEPAPPPPAATPPEEPSGGRKWLWGLPVAAGAAAGMTVLLGVGSAVLAGLGYAAMLAQPRTVGAEAKPAYQAMLGAYVGGLVGTGLLGVLFVAALLGTAAASGLAFLMG